MMDDDLPINISQVSECVIEPVIHMRAVVGEPSHMQSHNTNNGEGKMCVGL